ncbi:hypothetical protein FIV04_17510 (plasmid) [Vibrio sp. THAF190c]|nr:hypothetical protein FIV04_17510 [Vibrio sp. THAF190c]
MALCNKKGKESLAFGVLNLTYDYSFIANDSYGANSSLAGNSVIV